MVFKRYGTGQNSVQPDAKHVKITAMSELTNQIERLQRRVEKTMVRL
jgi:hypothetical protein